MLRLKPVSLKEANAYVKLHHRHHKPVVGHKFSIGCEVDGELAGVVIAGRPVSRYLDDGRTLEVTRLCTNGARNAGVSFMLRQQKQHPQWAMTGSSPTLRHRKRRKPKASGWTCQGKPVGFAGRVSENRKMTVIRLK